MALVDQGDGQPGAVTVTHRFAGATGSVPNARRLVGGLLSAAGEDTRNAVELMVSELASNAVRHGRSAFVLRVELDDQRVRVEVSDSGRGTPVVQSPDLLEVSGRGLHIVSVLATDWGVTPRPGGKAVWFSLDLTRGA